MHFPLTKYGLPQLVIYPLLVLVLMAFFFFFFKLNLVVILLEILLFLVFIWMLSFFRDPFRNIVPDENILFSPADGTVTDISEVNDSGDNALRIGIFLSVFNVHINRVPCAVRIESVKYKKGKFKNAMSPDSSRVNESNDIVMVRLSNPEEKIIVRQISGAIARHIVCRAKEGAEYRQGEDFGMIKFGSRTELYVPLKSNSLNSSNSSNSIERFEVLVNTGDKVKAAQTPLIRYKP